VNYTPTPRESQHYGYQATLTGWNNLKAAEFEAKQKRVGMACSKYDRCVH